MQDRVLKQGTIVRVEFDRDTAPIGREMADPGAMVEEFASVARVLAPERTIPDDYSASAYFIEIAIGSSSGLTTATVVALVKTAVGRLAARRRTKVQVQESPKAPGDETVRIAVRKDKG
jgi:hypothetical protein